MGEWWVLPVADRVEEELLARARAGRGAALGAGVITFGELERRLLEAAGLEVADPLVARLVAAQAAASAGKGTTFAPVASEPGFAPALLSVLDALREGGVDLPDLEGLAGRTTGLTRRRLEGLSRIGAAYRRALGGLELVDRASAHLSLPARIRAGAVPEELRGGRLAIEDVLDLSTSRCRILAALAAAGTEVVVRLPDLDGRPGLAPSLEPIHRALALDAPGVKVGGKPVGGGPLAAFHARLFDPGEPTAGPVSLATGADEEAELRVVVRHVRALLASGVPADHVVIAARGLPSLRGRIGEALDAADIPWRDRRGAPALEAPPAALALQLAGAAAREFPREELARVITSRYADAGASAEGEPYLTARRIAELLRDAGSRDDRGEGHAARLEAHARRLDRAAAAEATARRADERRRDARLAHRAADRLARLLPMLRLHPSAPLAHHAATLTGALLALGVERRCRALEEGPGSFPRTDAAAARALARDRAALDAVLDAARDLGAAAARASLGPVTREAFARLLEDLLASVTLRPRGARGGAVLLADVSELTGRSVEHLVILGLFDGGFPRRRVPEPLLDGADREAIDAAAGRPVLRPRGADEPLLFAGACLAARSSLLLTASLADAAGGERVPSPFLREAASALGRELPAPEPAGIVPALTLAATPREAVARLARLASGAAPLPGEPGSPELPLLGTWATRARRGFPRRGASDAAVTTLRSAAARAAIRAELARTAGDLAPRVAWLTSVSSLEDYASCPFRFLGRRVLRLPEPLIPDDDLDLREGGTLLHELARQVFTELGTAGLLPLQGGERAPVEQALAREAAERALMAWEKAQRTGPDPLWQVRREDALASILRLVEQETREAAGVVPVALEVAFGEGEEPPLLLPSPDGTRAIAVRGRVDRVDRGPEGFVVIDYKSGRVHDRLRGEEQGRTRFQLPIYAAWARRRFGGDVDAAYRSLRDGSRSHALSSFGPEQLDLEALLELDPQRRAQARAGVAVTTATGAGELPEGVDPNLADAAWAFLGSIEQGRFPVAPHDPSEACRFCAFATVCRIDRGAAS